MEKVLYKFMHGGNSFCITQDDNVKKEVKGSSIRLHEKGVDSLGNSSWTQVLCTHPGSSDYEKHMIHSLAYQLLLVHEQLKRVSNE